MTLFKKVNVFLNKVNDFLEKIVDLYKTYLILYRTQKRHASMQAYMQACGQTSMHACGRTHTHTASQPASQPAKHINISKYVASVMICAPIRHNDSMICQNQNADLAYRLKTMMT